MLSVGFEPAIPSIEQLQSYAPDRKSPVTGSPIHDTKFRRFSAVRNKQAGLAESQNSNITIVPEKVQTFDLFLARISARDTSRR